MGSKAGCSCSQDGCTVGFGEEHVRIGSALRLALRRLVASLGRLGCLGFLRQNREERGSTPLWNVDFHTRHIKARKLGWGQWSSEKYWEDFHRRINFLLLQSLGLLRGFLLSGFLLLIFVLTLCAVSTVLGIFGFLALLFGPFSLLMRFAFLFQTLFITFRLLWLCDALFRLFSFIRWLFFWFGVLVCASFWGFMITCWSVFDRGRCFGWSRFWFLFALRKNKFYGFVMRHLKVSKFTGPFFASAFGSITLNLAIKSFDGPDSPIDVQSK